MKFKLPRKTKKKLKQTMWLYPADEKGNSKMAFPSESKSDFTALKKGILRDIKAGNKAKRKKQSALLNKAITVSDKELKIFVDEIFSENYRKSSYYTLKEAKNTPRAIVAYYHFINAYHLFKKGNESYSNICCMAVDNAKKLIKKKRKK